MKLATLSKLFGLAAITAASLSTGCTTESYCFEDCAGEASGGSGNSGAVGGAGGEGATGGFAATGGNGGFAANGGGGAGGATCVPTDEVCDGVDNDCDKEIDEWQDVAAADLEKATSCGNCETNCFDQFGINYEPPTCTPPSTPGEPGTCTSQCVPDFYDLDPNAPGCEYYCPYNPNGTNTTDPGGADGCGKDDDCDGTKDEDVNTCDDVTNCGRCGRQCVIPNGTAKCVSTAAAGETCDLTNTDCEVDTCDAGFADNNGSSDDGCEYTCPVFPTTDEICDGIDNDCDGLIDNADPDLLTVTGSVIGDTCYGDPDGLCATAAHQGIRKCIGGNIRCCDPDSSGTGTPNHLNGQCDASTGTQVLTEGETQETCNAVDDDCDGYVDGTAAGTPAACTTDGDCNITERCIAPVGSTTTVCVAAPIDLGTCGTSIGNCQAGRQICNSGAKECVGAVDPATEDVCNGQDDDCDGVIDGTISGTPTTCTTNGDCTSPQLCLPQAGTSVSVCADPPTGAGGPCGTDNGVCVAGVLTCTGGTLDCQGDVGKTADVDQCGEDSNCDGQITNQPDLQTDVRNCGSCGNDCYANNQGSHGIWECQSGLCVRTDCEGGYVDCDTAGLVVGDGSTDTCESACDFTSSTEQCNGADDNCDCVVDNLDSSTPVPDPTAVCGVSPLASDTGCTSGVTVSCTAGDWQCSFPAGYCTGTAPEYCTNELDVCDGLDNNCDGAIDENFKQPILNQGYLTQVCYSDDGKATSDGACRTQGSYRCDGPNATACKDSGGNPLQPDLTKASAELCDGADNDCDGIADEVYNSATGAGDGNFVSPAVVQLSANLFIYQYEASRPDATATTAGSGNGYHTSGPTGTPLDATLSCSVGGAVPWFNVTPEEAAQTCLAVGGRVCTLADWQMACHAQNSCVYGYAPDDVTCTSAGVYSPQAGDPSCNIGAFDFDADPFNGNQDGVLPTGSSLLTNCFADWGGAANGIFDIMGNLREITADGANYTMMGGAFDTAAESGATCDFTFYTVDPAQNPTFKLYDTGFRCCFDTDPRVP